MAAVRSRAVGGGLPAAEGGGAAAGGGRRAAAEEGGAAAGGGRMCKEEGGGMEGGEYLSGGRTKAAVTATHDDGYRRAGESESVCERDGRSCAWG